MRLAAPATFTPGHRRRRASRPAPAATRLGPQTENIRIAYIDTIAPGTSSVTFRLSVAQEQYSLGPLKLERFKVGARAAGGGGGV
jgi:hypothetical protein